MNGTFSGNGYSAWLRVRPGASMTYAFTVAEEADFVGTIQLLQRLKGTQAKTVVAFTGTAEDTLDETDVMSGTILNESLNDQYFRVQVYGFGESSSDISWAINVVAGALIQSFVNKEGVEVLNIKDNEVEIPTVLVSLPNVPTADPYIAGQVWSNAGVLTLSAGPATPTPTPAP